MKMNRMSLRMAAMAICLMATSLFAENLLSNGGFEKCYRTAGNVTKDVGFGVWRQGENHLVPSGWIYNPSYPGKMEVLSDGAPEGKNILTITADVDVKHKRGAHLYLAPTKVEEGKRYRLSLRIRKGTAAIGLYEYKKDRSMRGITVAQDKGGDEWKEISGVWQPGENFRNAYVVIMVPFGETVELDDARMEEMAPEGTTSANVKLENGLMKIELTPEAALASFASKDAVGTEYAFPDKGGAICTVTVNGTQLKANSLRRKGELLFLGFPDKRVQVTLRIRARKRYFTLEVVDVIPASMERLSLEFPLRKLASKSTIASANFNKEFVANLFALDTAPFCTVRPGAEGCMVLAADFENRHGFIGGIALLGMPRKEFFSVAKEVEADFNLPSPKLDGKWLRESEPIRRSYLMVVDMAPGDIDALIQYAKIGGFQTIVFSKDLWLKTHGHYEINTECFPRGMADFKAAAEKIHAAGLKIGVHLFGPSISSNDAYVTPLPDKRLTSVPCTALAESINETSDVVCLLRRPDALTNAGFPERLFRIGDEIIRYKGIDAGTPFRFTGCERGVFGTKAAPHAAGEQVRGFITKLDFFMLEPGSQLLEEVSDHFANIVNSCKIDLVYFDASDCEAQARPMGFDLRRYVDQCHYTFYRKFDHDVLYQTSVGLGFNMQWHIVARGASANGFGDIKKLLAKHMRIITYAEHFAFADVGWYGLDPAIRLPAIEYIAAKCLACDGSISIQGSRKSLEEHPQGREIFEMLARYEQCRVSRALPRQLTDLLLDKEKDFRLYGSPQKGWTLFEARPARDQMVRQVDGRQNRWTVENPWSEPAPFALEILRFPVYDNPDALVLEDFTQPARFRLVQTSGNELTANLTHTTYPLYFGTHSGYFQAVNKGAAGASCTISRNYEGNGLDLSAMRTIAMWLRGYGKPCVFTLSLQDKKGNAWSRKIDLGYTGWRLHFFDISSENGVDWKGIASLSMTFGALSSGGTTCMMAGIKALPGVKPGAISNMELLVNGTRVSLPGKLEVGQSLTTDSLGECTIWPGGMKPGTRTALPDSQIKLKPGTNTIEFRYNGPGDGACIRLIPLQKQ